MTRLAALLCASALVALAGCAETSQLQKNTDASVIRIGTYDSRAIAVAFVGSEVYKATAGKKMTDMLAEYTKAASQGDTKRVEALKAWGQTQQARLHKQCFSTAPVDAILEHISGQLTEIKKQAGVALLVSRWDAKALAKHKSAKHVDVTMLLVEAFRPNAKQKKRAAEIQKHPPVPLEKMKGHPH